MKAKTPGLSLTRAYRYTPENLLAAAGPATKYKNVCGVPLVNNKGYPKWLNKNPNPGNSGRSNRPNTLRRSYDALGRLVYEYNHKAVTSWTHDGLDPVLATNARAITQYLRDSQTNLVGERAGTGTPRWYVNDMLGSIAGDTGAAGTVAGAVVNYSDYGNQLSDSSYNFGFGGERTDSTSNGTIAYYHRAYTPTLATWHQSDAFPGDLRIPATMHRFTFAANNPTTNTDKYGLFVPILVAAVLVASTVLTIVAPQKASAPSKQEVRGNSGPASKPAPNPAVTPPNPWGEGRQPEAYWNAQLWRGPNAARGYIHWLTGGGQGLRLPASSIAWKLTADEDFKRNFPCNSASCSWNTSTILGATTSGFNASEHIGRGHGTFIGNITYREGKYGFRGTFYPGKDPYNFDVGGRSFIGGAATLAGAAGGVYAQVRSFGIIRPMDYDIYFDGSVEINQ